MIRRLVNRLRIRLKLRYVRKVQARRAGRAAFVDDVSAYAEPLAVRPLSLGPVQSGLLAGLLAPSDPSRIPDDAKSKSWEACHLFPAGARIERTDYGLNCSEPPLAMVCPECDLKQPALHQGQSRACGYCGSNLQSHGSRIFHWPLNGQAAEWSYQR